MAAFSKLAVTLPQRIQSETVFSFTSSCNHTTPFLLSLLSYPHLSHCCSFPLFSASFIYSFSDSAPTLIQHQRTNPYTRNTAAAATINTVFVIFFSPFTSLEIFQKGIYESCVHKCPHPLLKNPMISYFFFLRRITVPPRPAIPAPASRIQNRIGVLSPVFGEVDFFVSSVVSQT